MTYDVGFDREVRELHSLLFHVIKSTWPSARPRMQNYPSTPFEFSPVSIIRRLPMLDRLPLLPTRT